MKILYFPIISPHAIVSNDAGDYQADTLFHGLRSVLGESLVDGYKMWHLYNTADKDTLSKLWGKGFTTYGLLPDLDIDRDDLASKIRNNYFDSIICPIHHTEIKNYHAIFDTLDRLLKYYPPNKIALVDGWDRAIIDVKLATKAQYFKREMYVAYEQIAKPISFSLPKEKIQELKFKRESDFAPLVPAYGHFDDPHQKTYIYDTEEDYYDMYAKSFFAYTCKKAREDDDKEGWDCMRHYEILACGSIPFFTDIERCSPLILTKFPKELCVRAKKIRGVYPGTKSPYDSNKDTFIGTSKQIKAGDERGYINHDEFDLNEYEDIRQQFREHTLKHLTTESMAKYLLEEMKKCSE